MRAYWLLAAAAIVVCSPIQSGICAEAAEENSTANMAATAPAMQVVRFQLRVDCMCSSCAFATEAALKKTPGVKKVSLSARARTLDITFDESKSPLSTVAASLSKTMLGERCALIARSVGNTTSQLDWKAVDALKSAPMAGNNGDMLLDLAPKRVFTTRDLCAACAKAGAVVQVAAAPR